MTIYSVYEFGSQIKMANYVTNSLESLVEHCADKLCTITIREIPKDDWRIYKSIYCIEE